MKADPRMKFGKLALASLAAFVLCLAASVTFAQDDPNTVSRDVPEQTITFDTTNPYTKAPGKMTIVFRGVFHFTTQSEGPETGTRVTGSQAGSFTFVPDDPSQSTVQGSFRFRLSGHLQKGRDIVDFAFSMTGVAQDGSRITFIQSQRGVLKEDGIEISFGDTRAVGARQN
jgi:hypothetical protein